jgi:PTS system mannose-specific IIB component
VFWVRIDNRLVHGQIIEAWLPFTDARSIVVVNDGLAEDKLRQQIMSLAIPMGVDISFVAVEAIKAHLSDHKLLGGDVMLLFANCQDARRAFETGLGFTRLNLGNMHYSPGKRHVCQHIALSKEDEGCLDFFLKQGVLLDYRCIPSDPVQIAD